MNGCRPPSSESGCHPLIRLSRWIGGSYSAPDRREPGPQAVTGAERSSELPNVPSMAEAGYPEVNIGLWSGVFVAANTPPAVAQKLEAELRRAMADPGVREKLKAMAVNPGGGPGAEFRAKIEADIKVFADVVKAANLKFEE